MIHGTSTTSQKPHIKKAFISAPRNDEGLLPKDIDFYKPPSSSQSDDGGSAYKKYFYFYIFPSLLRVPDAGNPFLHTGRHQARWFLGYSCQQLIGRLYNIRIKAFAEKFLAKIPQISSPFIAKLSQKHTFIGSDPKKFHMKYQRSIYIDLNAYGQYNLEHRVKI